jgi:hypothetical protein
MQEGQKDVPKINIVILSVSEESPVFLFKSKNQKRRSFGLKPSE